MTISMDKKYRTRDGRDVRLLCVDGPCPKYPVVGYVEGGTSPMHWSERGEPVHGVTISDLIEYHEPDIRTIWVNVYEGYVEVFTRQEYAHRDMERHAITIAQPVTFEVKRT